MEVRKENQKGKLDGKEKKEISMIVKYEGVIKNKEGMQKEKEEVKEEEKETHESGSKVDAFNFTTSTLVKKPPQHNSAHTPQKQT